MKEKSLQEYGQYFQTDKHEAHQRYLDTYELYLKPLKDKPVNLLEIGVRDGCSHRMWDAYFSHPDSRIFGIDIDPRCVASATNRIDVTIGSQADSEVIQNTLAKCKDGFDVIIDDGSHINELTVKSFQFLYDSLKPSGYYIIEDLGCSYLEEQLENHINIGQWPGMKYNKNVHMVNRRKDLDKFFLDIIRDIDLNPMAPADFVHFYPKIAIIKKSK